MTTAQIQAIKNLLAAMGTDPERTARIVAACRGADGNTGRDALLTTKQAAALIVCHPKQVFRYATRFGIEPVRRSARCIRWRESDVEKIRGGAV